MGEILNVYFCLYRSHQKNRMITSKLPNVGTTIFSVMSALAAEEKAINLSQGFPNFKIDQRLKDLVSEGLQKEQVQYAPMPGRLDLREEICRKIFIQHGKELSAADEITITAGATQAIYCAIAAVISAGDEVILFDPSYDCYAPTITLNGGIPIHLKLKFPEFRINWEEVEENLTEKTKIIVVNNPHNPAGSVWDEKDLQSLEVICRKNPNLIVLSDEVYEHIQFQGTHQSVLRNDFLRARSFVTYSFGKTFHVTGWKVGYCIAPEKLMTEFRKVHQFNVFCVNNTIQYALAEYLRTAQDWRNVMPMFTEKRSFFRDGMKNSRFRALACDGTYFCLYDYSEISDLSDVEFAKWMTKEHKVASIPVSVFYADKTDNKVIRFCFAKDTDTISKALEKLCKI
jgi:methionine transaminase